MTTEKQEYPQCRCARFGQSRFGPVKRRALDGVVWWVTYDYAKGCHVTWHKFRKRRQALVQLAIDFRHNRLPYDPDPGYGKNWVHERTAQEVAWLVDHRRLETGGTRLLTKAGDGTVLVRRRVWRLTDGSCFIDEPGRDTGREVAERLQRFPELRVIPPRRGQDRWVYVTKGWKHETK